MNNAIAARASMGTSLGFHIIFSVLGVGMPLLLVITEGLALRRHDPVWLELTHRWARAFGVLFAVGAVSGTVLSFEMGLLWPAFMRLSGSIIGLPFSAEGVAFFIEAIFLGLYLYGWDRLSPLTHWLTGLPIALSGAASALSVTTVNAWMNSPSGFSLRHGQVVAINPWRAIFNPSTPTECVHVLLSAYLVTAFGVASVYAAGILRGRTDPLHRYALGLSMAMGAVVAPLMGISGDASARFVATAQPAKLAAMEALFHTRLGAPLTIGGIPDATTGHTIGGIEIPHALSLLLSLQPNSRVRGLDSVPAADRPPVIPVHLAFDTMVGSGITLVGLAALFWLLAWRGRRIPTAPPLSLAIVFAGPLAYIGMESGWLVTEFGRQPWVVYGILRTTDAATTASGVAMFFALFLSIYCALALTTVRLLLRQAARNRAGTDSGGRSGAEPPRHAIPHGAAS